MNTKRIIFWIGFAVILGLIIWGLVVAMNKSVSPTASYGTAPAVTSTDHAVGPADAKVTLIEYGDFQCPACSAYAPIVERLISEAATGTLRVVFRHYPLPQHANAMAAAQAADAAGAQGKFWEMYKLLFSNQTTWQNDSADVARTEFEGYAAQLGLDKQKFIVNRDAPATKARIEAGRAEAQSLNLDYTPTFFVNGSVIPNPQGYEPFKAIIDEAAK